MNFFSKYTSAFASTCLLYVVSINSLHPPLRLLDEEIQAAVVSKEANKAERQHISPVYQPASSEQYIMNHSIQLGFDSGELASGCHIWKDPQVTNNATFESLLAFEAELENHSRAIQSFEPIPDLLQSIIESNGRHDVCKKARPHPDGLLALFPSHQLSHTITSGYVEPILPPMRHVKICNQADYRKHLMSMDYLVHDFEAMCQKLKPTSKRVLIDMGASLDFQHRRRAVPIVELLELYEKFGFHFDHIYAHEITFTEPSEVFENLLPEKYLPAFHWINVGVNPTEGHKLNPLHSILERFAEDDFIVVKLDIDSKLNIEVPLAKQLLEGGKDGIYHKLVDQFYFEHHVRLQELARDWGTSMKGTVHSSLDLFHGLRQKGIPAHFWP